MNPALKIANVLMALMFLFSVIVQYNDPDPIRWMAIYGAAMLSCILFLFNRNHWLFSLAVLSAALIWAAIWAPGVIGKTHFTEMFEAWEMKNERVEEAREFGGLMIVATWMAVLTAVTFLRRRK